MNKPFPIHSDISMHRYDVCILGSKDYINIHNEKGCL